MFPLKDNLPTQRFPIVTLLLIVINVGVYVWQTQFPVERELEQVGLGAIDASALEYGAIPQRITHPGESECFFGAVSQGSSELVERARASSSSATAVEMLESL